MAVKALNISYLVESLLSPVLEDCGDWTVKSAWDQAKEEIPQEAKAGKYLRLNVY